jgi:hypothetical protein
VETVTGNAISSNAAEVAAKVADAADKLNQAIHNVGRGLGSEERVLMAAVVRTAVEDLSNTGLRGLGLMAGPETQVAVNREDLAAALGALTGGKYSLGTEIEGLLEKLALSAVGPAEGREEHEPSSNRFSIAPPLDRSFSILSLTQPLAEAQLRDTTRFKKTLDAQSFRPASLILRG